jgi:hypothetical protein
MVRYPGHVGLTRHARGGTPDAGTSGGHMRIMVTTRRLTGRTLACLAGSVMLAVTLFALATPAASAQTIDGSVRLGRQSPSAQPADGWVRLAHLSPTTPAMDIYLFSLEGPATKIILRHVTYGSISQFETVTAGVYAVAMRPAGAPASATPLVSSNVKVVAGDAYTIAALGPASALRLGIFPDPRTTPAGSALVQVIAASLKQNEVTVTAGSTRLASNLTLGNATSFVAAPAGTWTVWASGPTQTVNERVSLGADTIDTLVVLDGQHGLTVDDLVNAAGSTVMPKGGVQTGFGGAAARPGAPLLPWAIAALFGLTLIAVGSVFASRRQSRAS